MMINNTTHQKILDFFQKYQSKSDQKEREWVQHYLGSNKPTRCIKSSEMKMFAKTLIKENNFDLKCFVDLLNSLYQQGTTFEEMDIAARLVGVSPKLCQQLDPDVLENWLKYTHGWAEVDLLCQSNFTSKQLLSDWNTWKNLLTKLSEDKNINKRRASLVLLNKSFRDSDDPRLKEFAFQQIEKLKSEKEVLITKAISWVLRSMVKFHSNDVKKYLEEYKDTLPKIAYRETMTKLLTGKK